MPFGPKEFLERNEMVRFQLDNAIRLLNPLSLTDTMYNEKFTINYFSILYNL